MYGSVGKSVSKGRESGRKTLNILFLLQGAGKTMLMDLFYETAQVAKKQRVHFNSFMLDVHDSKW